MLMVKPNPNRLESAQQPDLEPYHEGETPRYYVGRMWPGISAGINPARWQACVAISFEGKKVYPESWNMLADLATELYEHPWIAAVEKLAEDIKATQSKDARIKDEIATNGRRAVYFYLSGHLEEPVPGSESDV